MSIYKLKKTLFILLSVLFIINTLSSHSEAALPKSGSVDCLYGIKWEKPHFKKNKIYITLINETAVFQSLSLRALFLDSNDDILAEAPFEVGLASGKSIRSFSKVEKARENLKNSINIKWIKE